MILASVAVAGSQEKVATDEKRNKKSRQRIMRPRGVVNLTTSPTESVIEGMSVFDAPGTLGAEDRHVRKGTKQTRPPLGIYVCV